MQKRAAKMHTQMYIMYVCVCVYIWQTQRSNHKKDCWKYYNPYSIDTSEVLKYEFQDAWNEKKHSRVLSPEERDISSPSVPVKVHVLSSHWPELGHMHIPEPITVGKGMDPLWGV